MKANATYDIAPSEAGYDEDKLALLEAHYTARIESGALQGASFLLARDGKVFARRAMGRLAYAAKSPTLKTNSIKCIASITKLFTATAIMKLVEEGRLWLEQPVKTVIPELNNPLHGDINIRHLLTHTSGLPADPGYFCEPYPIDRYALLREKDWITRTVLAGTPHCPPGREWNYCTAGYALLGEIVTRVSGRHYNHYVQDEIMKPLGMTRSFLEVPKRLWPEVCLAAPWQREELAEASRRKGAPRSGGGVYSTLDDLFKFGQCFLDDGTYGGARILGMKTAQEMMRNQLCDVPAFHWGKKLRDYRQGLGFGFYCDGSTVGPETVNHEGWGWCSLFIDPIEHFIFVSFVADVNDWNPDLMVSPRTIAFAGLM